MNRVCVITSDGRAYYAIVSKLRSAGLPFLSLLPSDGVSECGLVVTTKREAASFASPTMALEDLDQSPEVARGQILSKLTGGGQILLVGVDPGSRIGAAAFLDEARLGSRTFNSRRSALAWVAGVVEGVPSKRSVVRVGDGDPKTAKWLADTLTSKLQSVLIDPKRLG
jgi:hypothetical protein